MPAVSGSGGLSGAFDVSGANGNVVGVDLSGTALIPVLSWNLLTVLTNNDASAFPDGECGVIGRQKNDRKRVSISEGWVVLYQ